MSMLAFVAEHAVVLQAPDQAKQPKTEIWSPNGSCDSESCVYSVPSSLMTKPNFFRKIGTALSGGTTA